MAGRDTDMNCEVFSELVFDFLDGFTDSETTAAMKAHAGICDKCARELDKCRSLNESIAGARIDPPEELSYIILKKLGEEKKKRPIWRKAALYASTAAAAVLLFVAIGSGISNMTKNYKSDCNIGEEYEPIKNGSNYDNPVKEGETDDTEDSSADDMDNVSGGTGENELTPENTSGESYNESDVTSGIDYLSYYAPDYAGSAKYVFAGAEAAKITEIIKPQKTFESRGAAVYIYSIADYDNLREIFIEYSLSLVKIRDSGKYIVLISLP